MHGIELTSLAATDGGRLYARYRLLCQASSLDPVNQKHQKIGGVSHSVNERYRWVEPEAGECTSGGLSRDVGCAVPGQRDGALLAASEPAPSIGAGEMHSRNAEIQRRPLGDLGQQQILPHGDFCLLG